MKTAGSVLDTLADFGHGPLYILPTRCNYSTFDEQDKDYVMILFSELNHLVTPNIVPNSVFGKCSSIFINGQNIMCSSPREKYSSPWIVLLEWDVNLYDPITLADPTHSESKVRQVKVDHIAKVSINVGEKVHYLVVTCASWYYTHLNQRRLGKPADVWCYNLFERYSLHSYLPVEKIANHCVHCVRNVHDERVMIVISLVE